MKTGQGLPDVSVLVYITSIKIDWQRIVTDCLHSKYTADIGHYCRAVRLPLAGPHAFLGACLSGPLPQRPAASVMLPPELTGVALFNGFQLLRSPCSFRTWACRWATASWEAGSRHSDRDGFIPE